MDKVKTSPQTYNEASKLIGKLIIYELEKQGRKMLLDDELKHYYQLLTLYFTNNTDFENHHLETRSGKKIKYSLKKGLLVCGVPGRSKSFMFEKVLPHFLSKFYNENKYTKLISYRIAASFEKNGSEALYEFQRNNMSNKEIYYNIYIDEIGAEPSTVKNYGNEIKPMEFFLDHRHRILLDTGKKTHGSTNFTLSDFEKYYSKRTYSRLFELFNIIILQGEDLRIDFIN